MSILSIDIGGTSIKYALMGKDAVILSRGKIPTPQEGRRELVEAIGRLYDEMPDVEGIAISMPGIIDSENGYCVMGGALGYNDDFYFRHVLYSDCPYMIPRAEIVTCKFQNDANLYGALQCYLEYA